MSGLLSVFVLLGFIAIGRCCSNGWLTHNNMCYHFSRETETWLGATQMCNFMQGTLVEIDTQSENEYLKAQASVTGHDTFWIALSDVEEEGTWKWMITKQLLSGDSFSDWNPSQPNNIGGQECGTILLNNNNGWNDDDCKNNYNYICEKANRTYKSNR